MILPFAHAWSPQALTPESLPMPSSTPRTLVLDLELGAAPHAGDILADLTAAGSSGQR